MEERISDLRQTLAAKLFHPRVFIVHCAVFINMLLCPVDSSLVWLTEVVLLGSTDARLTELSLTEETRTLLELALGSSRGLAGGIWQKMEEYSHSKGTCVCLCL